MMSERIRNFFRYNILPVLPYLRKRNRGTVVNLCVLILFLCALNIVQIVHEASKCVEADAARSEEVHLICRNATWEQVDALTRTAKTFSKHRDGAFRVEYVRNSDRLYDEGPRYNVGILFVKDENKRYHGDFIVTYNSFMQNYSEFLLAENQVEIELTPLYFTEAKYTWDTFRYHVSDALGFHAGDTVMTVLDTEVPYFRKSPLGLDPSRLSEATVHFARAVFIVLLFGTGAVSAVILLELRAYRHDFAVFSTFGADYKRLILYMQYKMMLFVLLAQIPAVILSYFAGIAVYGRLMFRVPVWFFLRSAAISFVLVLVLTSVILKTQTVQTVIRRLTDENNESYVFSPRKGHIFWDPDRFFAEYTFLSLKRFVKYYALLLTLAAAATVCMNGIDRLNVPAEMPAEYEMIFSEGMEIEIYENGLSADILSLSEDLSPSAYLEETTADTGMLLLLNGVPAQNCVFRSAGSTLYRAYPEAEAVIASGRAFVLCKKVPEEIALDIPLRRTGIRNPPSNEKESVKYFRENFAYEQSPLDAEVLIIESDETVVWLPLAQYMALFGSQTAILAGRHVRMPEKYADEGDVLSFVPYRSRLYTDEFVLRCEPDLTRGTLLEGDYEEIWASSRMAVRGNREVLCGLHVGDTLELSSAGRMRAGTKETAVPASLSAKLTKLLYDYETFILCAVIEDENAQGLELLVSPVRYEALTGVSVMLRICEIETETAQDPTVESALEKIASSYYETSLKRNRTARARALAEGYKRPAESAVLKTCVLSVLVLLMFCSLSLFDARRGVERLALTAFGGSGKTVRCLMLGAHAAGLCGCLLVYFLIRVFG